VFITAAGNDGKSTPFYPAAYPETLPVTAIDNGQLASYANRASYITLGAPGTSIVYFNNQPYIVQGTSPSAAFISGMASGYMDVTHSGVDKVPAFLQSNFGVKITPAK
jgi:thermitase